jgi:ubiquinol-cytochrome c reductase cytochrome b subunit
MVTDPAGPTHFGPTKNSPEIGDRFVHGEMAGWVKDNVASKKVTAGEIDAVVEFLASLSGHKGVGTVDSDKVAAGQKFFALGSDAASGACYDCHAMKLKEDPEELFKEPSAQIATGAPELMAYGSREWLKDFIRNPADKRFYGSHNAMPAFGDQLSEKELTMLVEWLLHQWPVLEPKTPASQSEQ